MSTNKATDEINHVRYKPGMPDAIHRNPMCTSVRGDVITMKRSLSGTLFCW